MGEIETRVRFTDTTLAALKDTFDRVKPKLLGKACIYATGSFGRSEAGPQSDLDLFIVGDVRKDDGTDQSGAVTRLDQIEVKAALIQGTRDANIPDFDGDGRYLVSHRTETLLDNIGSREDDAQNTLSARLLLILESRPLVEYEVYKRVIDDVLGLYWRDYPGREKSFVPAYLTNDILRLWRIFCVGYESRARKVGHHERLKRKVKNYKLKHSRLLTCYSALLFLLSRHAKANSVSPDDARELVLLTPLERVRKVAAEMPAAASELEQALQAYESFLLTTNKTNEELMQEFADREQALKRTAEARKFGDHIYHAIRAAPENDILLRMLIV